MKTRNRTSKSSRNARVGAALALLVGLWVPLQDARACFCAPPTLEEAIAESDLIVSGVVAERLDRGDGVIDVILDVEAVWKGPIQDEVLLRAGAGDCTVFFREGQRYIVYGTDTHPEGAFCERPWGSFRTDLCTRTRPFSIEEASALGTPRWRQHPEGFRRGDTDENGGLEVTDSVIVLAALFQGGAGHPCGDVMDVNDDGSVDLSDAVFGLGFLFLGGPPPPAPGPVSPGFDQTTDDPFVCGDGVPPLECSQEMRSDLPGVRVEILDAPCSLTLAEAREGVTFTYRVHVDEDVDFVRSTSLATCVSPGPAGIHLRPLIRGNDQRYCLCDLGKCPFDENETQLVAGDGGDSVFRWCGRNWFGPSDFVNPVGEAFPPGVYTFEVRGTGSWSIGKGPETPYEILTTLDFELTE